MLTTRPAGRRPDEGPPISATTALPNDHLLDPKTRAIPIRLYESGLLEEVGRAGRANLSPAARRYLAEIGAGNPDAEPAIGAAPWLHALAVAHAPDYLDEHRAAIFADYPRVPLPADVGTLTASAALGQRLADLLDPERRVEGVTGGPVLPVLRRIGVPVCKTACKTFQVLECAPAGGQNEVVDLTPLVGLLKDRSHGQASFP